MSKKYKFRNPEGLYFITFTVNGWVDVFSRKKYKDILISNLKHCQNNKGLELFAWVIMTNHVHLIARGSADNPLQGTLRDFKKFTSKELMKRICKEPGESRKEWMPQLLKTEKGIRFWRSGNHPIELWSNGVIDQKLDYIHNNPVAAGLVFRPEDYVYSSAVDYAGEKGLLDLVLLQ